MRSRNSTLQTSVRPDSSAMRRAYLMIRGILSDSRTAPVIAIDGPSASGKGTIAGRVAKRLGFHYLESGALYRLVALRSLRADTMDEQRLAALADSMDVVFDVGET